jgi:phosphatidylserine decarboxylase
MRRAGDTLAAVSARPPLRARFAAALIDRSPDWSTMAATRAMGAASRARLPGPITRAAIRAYSAWFDVELEELETDAMSGFSSFDEFFTRRLRPGARPVDPRPGVLVSPCDGALREVVPIGTGTEIRAKGHAFLLEELLADDPSPFAGGWATTIYLHPRDYHRVHAPCGGEVESVTAIPGRLLPVTDASVEREASLFALNERVVFQMSTAYGPMAVVMVAAFGVGHVSSPLAPVEAHGSEVTRVPLDPPMRVERAGELGTFHLGSTVIIVAPAGLEPMETTPRPLRLGEGLFSGEVVA